jgi:hypothetical protein
VQIDRDWNLEGRCANVELLELEEHDLTRGTMCDGWGELKVKRRYSRNQI